MATVHEPPPLSPQLDSQTALTPLLDDKGIDPIEHHSPSIPFAEPSTWPPPKGARCDRRREVRFATDQAAVLTEINPLSFGITPVRVRNVSRHGLRIYVPHLLYRGALVHVRIRKTVLTGEVRYCLKCGEGHVAGMAVLDVIPYNGPSTIFDAISSWTDPSASNAESPPKGFGGE